MESKSEGGRGGRGGRTRQGEPHDENPAVKQLQSELKALPELEPPQDLWPAIERRMVTSGLAHPPAAGRTRWGRLARPRGPRLQVAGMAAALVIGLGLGRLIVPGAGNGVASSPGFTQPQPAVRTVADALENVRRSGAEYDAALGQLELVAGTTGTPLPSLAQQRLVALDLLVEASRAALAAEPADPELNAYLFAALEQRDNVMREMSGDRGAATNGEVVWR